MFSAMSPELSTDLKVQCFSCNSVLITSIAELKNGPFVCRFCSEDLRPTHSDPGCSFCRGVGYATVNDVVWICLGESEG